MNARTLLPSLFASSLLTLPSIAFAGQPEGEAGGEVEAGGSISLGGDAGGDAEAGGEADAAVDTDAEADAGTEGPKPASNSKLSKRKDRPWIKRWAPEPHMIEIGLYGGILLLPETHELFSADLDLPEQGYKPLRRLNPDLGLRVGYYPLRFFGIEAEGGVMPSKLADEAGSPLLYTMRGHLVGQLGLWSVTPFVLLGAGGLGVASPRSELGNDIDPSLHFGGGVKIYINRYVMLRLDLRDVVTHKQGVDNAFISHNLEALLGLSITLGREKDRDTRSDRDGDGFYDDEDSCPDEAGVAPDGCPIRDTDGDGFTDDVDQCVDQAETVNDYKDDDGCPESDRDGDGFWDDQDTCPDEAGVDPDGCPIPDTDGDGILDPADQCVQEPETDNGYRDADGCPDEVPTEVARFTGRIEGITFDTDKDTIRKSSTKTLDGAIKVLKDFPDVRIEVSGHTDDQGDRDHNLDLSRRRAEAVKKYLVDAGIDASRIETVGHGPDKPIEPNDTKAGRAKNRRIEFKILSDKPARTTTK